MCCGIIGDIGDVHVFSSQSLQFLQEVASHSDTNKMDVKNLAIIIAPSVMPVEERIVVSGTSRLSHHVQVVEVRTQMYY
jgi:RhoGAP domain.